MNGHTSARPFEPRHPCRSSSRVHSSRRARKPAASAIVSIRTPAAEGAVGAALTDDRTSNLPPTNGRNRMNEIALEPELEAQDLASHVLDLGRRDVLVDGELQHVVVQELRLGGLGAPRVGNAEVPELQGADAPPRESAGCRRLVGDEGGKGEGTR